MVASTDERITRELVRQYAQRLVAEKPDVWRVYMFGSHVRGTARPDSDIDVAVFLNRNSIDSFLEDSDLMQLRWDIDLRIEPQAFTKSDFENPDPYIHEIINTGVRVI